MIMKPKEHSGFLRSVVILAAIASIICYSAAPVNYNLTFAIVCLIVFIVSSSALLFNNCKHSFIKFEFFFLVACFFTFYSYPVFLYSINPNFSLFALDFNENYICKGIALSTMGLAFFNWGIFNRELDSLPEPDARVFCLSDRRLSPPNKLLFYGLMALFIPYMVSLWMAGEYNTEFENSFVNCILVFLIYYCLYTDFANCRLPQTSTSIKKLISFRLIIVLFYTFLFLAIGSRTIPMRVVLCLLFLFDSFVRPFRKSETLLIVAIGAFVLTLVGIVREGNGFEFGSLTSFLDFGKDLTINNRSLYVIMEYVDKYGISYGRTMLLLVFSAIPFAQSTFMKLTGISAERLDSGNLVTFLEFGKDDPNRIGLGTNVIGDIYLAFGAMGVVVLMYIFGRLLKHFYNRFKKGNLLNGMFYMLLFMDVIYLPRSGYLTGLRPIVWCYVIYIICNSKSLSRK